MISSAGTTRRTFVLRRWALKFARNGKGRDGNQFEYGLCGGRPILPAELRIRIFSERLNKVVL